MDYVDIMKKSAAATWRHPILWLFGLFTGVWTGYQSFNYSFTSEDWMRFLEDERTVTTPGGGTLPVRRAADALARFLERLIDSGDWVWWVATAAGILFVLMILTLIVRVAAQGGLIYLAQEALEDRETRGMAGWREGFHAWFRVFGVALLMALPLVFAGLLTLVAGVAAFFVAGATDAEPLSVGAILAWIAGLALVALVMVPVTIVLGLLREVAWRHVVLGHASVTGAIAAAWHETWGRQGVWGMWLAQLVVGIAYGLVVGMALLFVGVAVLLPLGLLAATADAGFGALLWVAIAAVVLLLLLAPALLVGAAYSAFRSTAWTEFYERMTAQRNSSERTAQATST